MAPRAGRVIVGCQDWSVLLFLHWRVPVSALRPHVHERLSIDERDGSAWVSASTSRSSTSGSASSRSPASLP